MERHDDTAARSGHAQGQLVKIRFRTVEEASLKADCVDVSQYPVRCAVAHRMQAVVNAP